MKEFIEWATSNDGNNFLSIWVGPGVWKLYFLVMLGGVFGLGTVLAMYLTDERKGSCFLIAVSTALLLIGLIFGAISYFYNMPLGPALELVR